MSLLDVEEKKESLFTFHDQIEGIRQGFGGGLLGGHLEEHHFPSNFVALLAEFGLKKK